MTSRYSLVRWEADVGFRLERWFAGHSAKPRHQTPHQHACAFPIAVLCCCCRYGVVTRPRSYISYSRVVTSHDLCGDWWHRPYASVLLEMERVVVRRFSWSYAVFVTLHWLQSPSRARNFRTAARHSLPSCAAAQLRGNVAMNWHLAFQSKFYHYDLFRGDDYKAFITGESYCIDQIQSLKIRYF